MTGADERLARAEEILSHRFGDRSLLLSAITHPSCGASTELDYERLEFLGDAVLGMIVGAELFARFPDLLEGSLTKMRAALVSRVALASVARDLGVEEAILLGPSELADGSRGLPSALAACYEALVGALYLDAGLPEASRFVLESLGDRISRGAAEHPKSALQELLQGRGLAPAYRELAEEGPPHARTFTVEVHAGGEVLGRGTGPSKKDAEMRAAEAALARLQPAR